MRPTQLDLVVGQPDLLGPGSLLRNLIEQDKVGSLLLWGPPGCGKTTLARVIANSTSSAFKSLSATSATTADLRAHFEEATNLLKLTGRKTFLMIDEIQRFSKAQQDLLLPVVEAGLVSLIAATTENPSFRVNKALLSRCRVFVLHKLLPEDIYSLLVRALAVAVPSSDDRDEAIPTSSSSAAESKTDSKQPRSEDEAQSSSSLFRGPINEELLHFLAAAADGDARVALSSLELAVSATASGDNTTSLSLDELKAQLRRAHLQYDRTGDNHYDTISALHKSVRGSDPDAALYWLARMLEAGEDPLYVARRLIRMASEDVGTADPTLLTEAVAAYQATLVIGMPECDVILAQVVVRLAEAKKSVRVYQAYSAAKRLLHSSSSNASSPTPDTFPVPIHLRNAPTGLMKSLGFGRDYLYEPSYAHPVYQPFFPPELVGTRLLKDDGDMEGKKVDEEALQAWERERLGGEKWDGREAMETKLAQLRDNP